MLFILQTHSLNPILFGDVIVFKIYEEGTGRVNRGVDFLS